tara:strand:+ start:235 stop:930 length:696 start_codon:yes stop_codon:yes gene_type:complete
MNHGLNKYYYILVLNKLKLPDELINNILSYNYEPSILDIIIYVLKQNQRDDKFKPDIRKRFEFDLYLDKNRTIREQTYDNLRNYPDRAICNIIEFFILRKCYYEYTAKYTQKNSRLLIDVNIKPIKVSITRCDDNSYPTNCLESRRYDPLNTPQEYEIEKEFERHLILLELYMRDLNAPFTELLGTDYNEIKQEVPQSRIDEDDEWVRQELSIINKNLYYLEEKYNIINNL